MKIHLPQMKGPRRLSKESKQIQILLPNDLPWSEEAKKQGYINIVQIAGFGVPTP